MIAWFRSKRQLIARITQLRADLKASKANADMWMQRCTDAHLSAEKVINQQTEQIAEYDRALTALRDSFERTRISRELAAEVRGGTTSPPAPRYNPNFTRLRNRPLPADLAEAIDEETAMKRRLDGEGDQ